jgi:flagella basal body P-ring formation protein FlgA
VAPPALVLGFAITIARIGRPAMPLRPAARRLRSPRRLGGLPLALAMLLPAAAPAIPAAGAATSEPSIAALRTVVRLRPAVRLAPGETTVRLRDVAWLEPSAARLLGDLSLGDLAADGLDRGLSPAKVREALAAAGAHPARILVEGGTVRIGSSLEEATAGAPLAMTAVRLAGDGRATTTATTADATELLEVEAVRSLPGEDVMAAATHRLITRLGVPADRLRIAVAEADLDWLSRPMRSVRMQLLDPAESSSVRLELIPRPEIDGSAVGGGRIVVLQPRVRVERVRTTAAIARGHRLDAGSLATEVVWVSPRAAAASASLDAVEGLEADRRIPADTVIGLADIRQPVVVRRGDGLIVRAGTTRMPVEMSVIARQDGRVGERIMVQRPGDAMEFAVLITAPGLARPAAPDPLRADSPAFARR